jgi:hypothetical protein
LKNVFSAQATAQSDGALEANHQPVADALSQRRAGPCRCSTSGSSRSITARRFQRNDSQSFKKKPQALAEANVVHRHGHGRVLNNMEDDVLTWGRAACRGGRGAVLLFDERPCQLFDHVLTLIPSQAGPPKEHQEYVRKGVRNVPLAYNPTGQRHLQVTTTKTKADYAHFMDWRPLPFDAAKIKPCKNYSTHSYGAFTNTCPGHGPRPAPPVRISLHAWARSWLNMAEIECSRPLFRQCSGPRIGTPTTRRRSLDLASQPKRGRQQ